MKNLIAIQSIIQQLENVTEMETKYKTTFHYESETKMIIETYCWEKAAAYKMMLQDSNVVCVYFESNTKLKIQDLKDGLI